MKRCPRCNRIYSDSDLNFCLDDGELLQHYNEEEPTRPLGTAPPPPTLIMDSPRVTNPIGWQAGQPIGQWQGQTGAYPQTQYQAYPITVSPNQTLAILSLCLGAASLVIGWCCSNGLILAPASIVIGIFALSQVKKDPQGYGGKGLAYAGIASGSLFLLFYALFILIYGLAAIGGALSR
jgi:hypothetical protein